jgi:hypothetical protein
LFWLRSEQYLSLLPGSTEVVNKDAGLSDEQAFDGLSIATLVDRNQQPGLEEKPGCNEQRKQRLFEATAPFPGTEEDNRCKERNP